MAILTGLTAFTLVQDSSYSEQLRPLDFNVNSWIVEAAESDVERIRNTESAADSTIAFWMPVRTARCRFIPYALPAAHRGVASIQCLKPDQAA